jgi:hypothetical protein
MQASPQNYGGVVLTGTNREIAFVGENSGNQTRAAFGILAKWLPRRLYQFADRVSCALASNDIFTGISSSI